MTRWSSTTLNEYAKRCPAAVTFALRKTPRDPRHFEVGIAAHAFLQSAGELTKLARPERPTEAQIATRWDALAKLLLEVGRVYRGTPEPPLNPDSVFAGREIARQYLRWNPEALSATASYEVGTAVDASGKAVHADHESARLLGILDVVEKIAWHDEETQAQGLLIRDYKTAWSTDAEELKTIQRKAQAILGWANFGKDLDFLTLEVVNLRTGKHYAETHWVAEGLEERLEMWLRDLSISMDALDNLADAEGNRPAIPSYGCIGCDFWSKCYAGQRFLSETKGMPLSPEQRAENFALVSQMKDAYAEVLREDTAERTIELIGCDLVGTVAKPSVVLKDEAVDDLVDRWELAGGTIRALAHALDIGPKNLIATAKVLYKDDREGRQAFIDANTETAMKREFGIHRNPNAQPQPTQRTRRRSKKDATDSPAAS